MEIQTEPLNLLKKDRSKSSVGYGWYALLAISLTHQYLYVS